MTDNKYTRYQFTAFEGQYGLLDEADKDFFKLLLWQDEIAPDTGRKHRQGCLATHRPVRASAVRAKLPGIHIEPARNWGALLNYCHKNESFDASGERTRVDNTSHKPPSIGDLLQRIADMVWDRWQSDQDLPPSHRDVAHPLNDRVTKETAKAEYWDTVNEIVYTEPNLIGILAQPLPQNAWLNTRRSWLRKAAERAEQPPESNSITDSGPGQEIKSQDQV